jgi:hypothetical protein
MKKFDYIILNEDNEWLSTGFQETQEQLDQEIEIVKEEQFGRWGEHLALVIFKASKMEKKTIF